MHDYERTSKGRPASFAYRAGKPRHLSRLFKRASLQVHEPTPHAFAREDVGSASLALDIVARLAEIDHVALRAYRLNRVRTELQRRDVAGALLADPLNIRYATGTRNMSLWTLHAPARYVFIATEGPVILFDGAGSRHLSDGFETVDETLTSTPWFYFAAGPRVNEKADIWAGEIASLVRRHGGRNRRLAVDRCEPWGAQRLLGHGIQLVDAQEAMEQARVIKSHQEILCLQLATDVADIAIEAMRATAQPGLTENQLWSVLHSTNISHDGEWIECRLLASGERTNPWNQESSNRVIAAGDLIAFDTDMVGPTGYLADLSRTFICPGRKATAEQRMLYELAQEQVLVNMELLRPGLGFREFAERSWKVPEAYIPNRYAMLIHGVGLVDEYPTVPFEDNFADWGYDGIFEENMTVSVESYIGELGGGEGVKLEEQVVITKDGAKPFSHAPLVDAIEL